MSVGRDRDLICFSHLRWDFVQQRPAAPDAALRAGRGGCLFFEEMIPTDHHLAYLEFHAFEGTQRHGGPAARAGARRGRAAATGSWRCCSTR